MISSSLTHIQLFVLANFRGIILKLDATLLLEKTQRYLFPGHLSAHERYLQKHTVCIMSGKLQTLPRFDLILDSSSYKKTLQMRQTPQ